MVEINLILLLNCNIVQFGISLRNKKRLIVLPSAVPVKESCWDEFFKSETRNGGSDSQQSIRESFSLRSKIYLRTTKRPKVMVVLSKTPQPWVQRSRGGDAGWMYACMKRPPHPSLSAECHRVPIQRVNPQTGFWPAGQQWWRDASSRHSLAAFHRKRIQFACKNITGLPQTENNSSVCSF